MSNRLKLTVVFVLALTTSLALARDKKDKYAAVPQAVVAKDAPPASGPYSQGIKAGVFVFAAGQVGRDPATGKLVEGGIAEQTDRALKNLSAVLTAAGTSIDKVVKATVFLKNISDFAKMNEVYGRYFKMTPPARTTVGVAGLPSDALVEIDVVALQ